MANARLTEEEVREIRRLLDAGNVTQQELGKKFGVAQETISAIKRRTRWNKI